VVNLGIYKQRFEAAPKTSIPGETSWVDRVNHWDDFVTRGADVAAYLRKIKLTAYDYDGLRGLAPELHDLLMEAFPA